MLKNPDPDQPFNLDQLVFFFRPENSLLGEDLEYESAVRQAPVFTEEVARKLEDIIRSSSSFLLTSSNSTSQSF